MREPHDLLPLTHLAYQILLALGHGDLHGYAIIKRVEEWTDGKMTPRSGTLYAAIQRLVDEGLVDPAAAEDGRPGVDGRRRHYRITARGREVARLESDRLTRLLRTARELDLAGAPRSESGR